MAEQRAHPHACLSYGSTCIISYQRVNQHAPNSHFTTSRNAWVRVHGRHKSSTHMQLHSLHHEGLLRAVRLYALHGILQRHVRLGQHLHACHHTSAFACTSSHISICMHVITHQHLHACHHTSAFACMSSHISICMHVITYIFMRIFQCLPFQAHSNALRSIGGVHNGSMPPHVHSSVHVSSRMQYVGPA